MGTAEYVIVAEDQASVRFTEQLLIRRGVNSRAIRSLASPPSEGSAKQWVTTQYPNQVKAHRSKAQHTRKALVVATDADEQSVAQRQKALADSLIAAELAPRGSAERIVLLVPRWEFETWAEHLNRGTTVDEGVKLGWSSERAERECLQAGKRLVEHRPRNGERPTCCLRPWWLPMMSSPASGPDGRRVPCQARQERIEEAAGDERDRGHPLGLLVLPACETSDDGEGACVHGTDPMPVADWIDPSPDRYLSFEPGGAPTAGEAGAARAGASARPLRPGCV
jgi:hypothetical protein